MADTTNNTMNQALIVQLSIEFEGHTFTFNMPVGCALGTAYNAGFKVLEKIMELAKESVDKANPAQPTASSSDDSAQTPAS